MQYLSNKLRIVLLYAIIFNFISSPILAKEIVIEGELVPFLNEWKALYQKACNKPIDQLVPPGINYILLRPTKVGVLGVCYYSYGKGFEIHISPSLIVSPRWNTQMYHVFAHELGHCLLDLRHNEAEDNYMFKYINRLTKEELESQIIEDMKNACDL